MRNWSLTKIEQLIHNGVLLSEIPYLGLSIVINGEAHKLTEKQEQMAIAWVRKLSTVYVEDKIFRKNYFKDFGEELGDASLTDANIDFSEVMAYVAKQKEIRDAKTKEQKKQEREERKAAREQLKEKYGTATLDGAQVEISNYTAEPSSIFMGRGEHPMRGKWKEGPSKANIVLNLSPEAPRPEGEWMKIIWEPECLWIAKWTDKLSGKTKYVWLSDTTPIKQDREIEKYDKANLVGDNLETIRKEILSAISGSDKRKRKIATACYIIDHLNIRVGDEKDEDEADTIGATTLRPEHVKINGLTIVFKFLGKDSVQWLKEGEFPEIFVNSLQELIDEAKESGEKKPQIFSHIGSSQVNAFFDEVVNGLTAKVFRTYHATTVVQNFLEKSDVDPADPDFAKKEVAVMANREAAEVCTHKKQEPKNWETRIEKFSVRKGKGQERIQKAKNNQIKREERLEEIKGNLKLRKKQVKEQEKFLDQTKEDLAVIRSMATNFATQREKDRHKNALVKAKKKIETVKKKVIAAEKRVETAKSQVVRGKNSVGTAKERVYKAKLAFKKIESQEKISKETKTWNLGTSLKSYIDPRVYYDWGKEVDYDWRNYYSNTLQKKFSWVERDSNE